MKFHLDLKGWAPNLALRKRLKEIGIAYYATWPFTITVGNVESSELIQEPNIRVQALFDDTPYFYLTEHCNSAIFSHKLSLHKMESQFSFIA